MAKIVKHSRSANETASNAAVNTQTFYALLKKLYDVNAFYELIQYKSIIFSKKKFGISFYIY
jgi:hypothetical protein